MNPSVAASLNGRTIMLAIVGHLASAPRAQKEARALRTSGARVVIRGTWSNPCLVDEDLALARSLDVDFAPVVDLRSRGGSLPDRARHRLAHEIHDRLGPVPSRVLGPGAPELLRAAERINADLTMVHSEPGLWVGRELLARGRRVGVDFEDWFSRDQPPADRPDAVRRVLQAHERYLLRNAHCCLTTTRVMARALAEDAGVSRLPTVVPNCLPVTGGSRAGDESSCFGVERPDRSAVSFYWFSQTIGPGRGLELLAQALPSIRGDWQLHLRGSLDAYRSWFESTFSPEMRERIHCHEPVTNDELTALTGAHDVGLALEIPYCDNKQLTASNKIHEYLRAGLAVIATGTRGQEEVMEASPGAGVVVGAGNAEALAAAMQRMLDEPTYLRSCQEHAAEAGRTVWDWARHEPVLLRALADALA